MLKKADGEMDFSLPAENLERRVRAFNPWPGAFTFWNHQPLKIHRAHVAQNNALPPGEKTVHEGLPAIACSSGLLVLDEVQPAGKRPMAGETFLHGAHDWGS